MLVFTKKSYSKLYKVRINSSVLQDVMKYIRKLQLILCAVHMYIIILKGKKTSNDKNKVFKEKKKQNYKKIPYISVNLVSWLFWIAISLFPLRVTENCRNIVFHRVSICTVWSISQ